MRVTQKTKEKTRSSILKIARKLFSKKGFDETTTRDIAAGAGIASGTLFNYFPSKEALGMELISEALRAAQEEYEDRRRGQETMEEELFLYVVTGLHHLEPHRNYLGPVLETALSPFVRSTVCEAGDQVRVQHLETVAGMLASHDLTDQPSFVAMHLYWTLYLGILSFWAQDASPHQEDTLVLLDQSMRLFADSISTNLSQTEVSHGPQD